MLTQTELHKKSRKDLLAELKKAREIALKTKLSLKMNQEKKSHIYQGNKRYIAQILTLLCSHKAEEAQNNITVESK